MYYNTEWIWAGLSPKFVLAFLATDVLFSGRLHVSAFNATLHQCTCHSLKEANVIAKNDASALTITFASLKLWTAGMANTRWKTELKYRSLRKQLKYKTKLLDNTDHRGRLCDTHINIIKAMKYKDCIFNMIIKWTSANHVDPDQSVQNTAFDHGLHRLPRQF